MRQQPASSWIGQNDQIKWTLSWYIMTDLFPVKVIPFKTIQGFFQTLEDRPHVRLVKIADQGLVQPARRGSAVVMQPMVRVVATAFDYKWNEILSWADTWDVGTGVVHVNVNTDQRRHDDPTGIQTREKIILECQKRSLQVVRDDEWTPEDIVDTLAGISPRSK
jgi:hypothetical protein